MGTMCFTLELINFAYSINITSSEKNEKKHGDEKPSLKMKRDAPVKRRRENMRS